MNPFESLPDYEQFVYTLQQRYPAIQHSTLVVVRRGSSVAYLQGEIAFVRGYRITILERLSMDAGMVVIEEYGYELWRNGDKLAWYDSQPHPGNLLLQSTDPHHRHQPPDIKHNRVPAPGMSFNQPNLPKLVFEIAEVVASDADSDERNKP